MLKSKRDESTILMKWLKDGEPNSVIGIINNIVNLKDETLQLGLIEKCREKLDMGYGCGWRILAANGTEAVKLKLINEYPDKLDIEGAYHKEGWLILSNSGTDAIKAKLMEAYKDKLDVYEGQGWYNLIINGSEAIQMKLIEEHPDQLNLRNKKGWQMLYEYGSDRVKDEIELRIWGLRK